MYSAPALALRRHSASLACSLCRMRALSTMRATFAAAACSCARAAAETEENAPARNA